MTDKFAWLEPLRKRARELEEETKRIREKTEHLREKTQQLRENNSKGTMIKFVSIIRTIDPKTGTHYLDGIDDKGRHWTAEMSHKVEPWMVYTKQWRKDPQQPQDI